MANKKRGNELVPCFPGSSFLVFSASQLSAILTIHLCKEGVTADGQPANKHQWLFNVDADMFILNSSFAIGE